MILVSINGLFLILIFYSFYIFVNKLISEFIFIILMEQPALKGGLFNATTLVRLPCLASLKTVKSRADLLVLSFLLLALEQKVGKI